MNYDLCNKIYPNSQNFDANFDSARFYCVDFSDNLKYGGFIDSKILSNFEIHVILCISDPERNTTLSCASLNKLKFHL